MLAERADASMSSPPPVVTFVVPCYKLAHFLGDCLRSILDQDYGDFEIIIMDDCSPDDTAAVAACFADPRIRYVKNAHNLGHLKNYNRGIELAAGRYVWLISADDRLRDPGSLSRLVECLDSDDDMSFAFSPGMIIAADGGERGIQGDCGDAPWRHDGPTFFARSILANNVCTPGVMVRTHRYRQVGFFPTDLPYAGEWYLWLRFALLGSIGYVPRPGVEYRQHAGSNTAIYTASDAAIIVQDEVAVRWRARLSLGVADHALLAAVDDAIATDYARRTYRHVTTAWPFGMTSAAVRQSIDRFATDDLLCRRIWSAYCEALGDQFLDRDDRRSAREWYRRSLSSGPVRAAVSMKLALALTGRYGSDLRQRISRRRQPDRQTHDHAAGRASGGNTTGDAE
jgi:hypothetical protein